MFKFSTHPLIRIKTEEEVEESLFNKEERLEHFPSIPEFFTGQDVFVTGGTGFLGKVLIEKLLRSCSGIRNIFILLRSKKGKSIDQRLKAMIDLPLFGPLRKRYPEVVEKLVAVEGDVTELKMGLSQADIDKMKDVSIIFHSAASVKFDDPLQYAIILNTRGTREVMRFAESLKNIKVVMHVSTTYSNPDQKVIEEKIYPEYVSWEKTVEIAEKLDEDQLNALTKVYMNHLPNTYVFSKNLAEHVSYDYKDKLPVVVFRPSIVVSAIKEPLLGWVDNFNGPVGLLVGSGIGIVRTMYSDPDNRCDFLPVDVCVKAMIIAAWQRAHDSRQTLPVYNCASYNIATVKIQQIVDIGKNLTETIPLDKMIFRPGGNITKNRYSNYLKLIFYQLLPALIIDAILKFKGHKPILMKVQRKIFEANSALEYFVMNEWPFINNKFIALTDSIKLTDLKDFDYRDCFNYDVITLVRICMIGCKKYLLYDDDKNHQRNLIKFKFLKAFHQLLCALPYIILFCLLIKYDVFRFLK